MQAFGKPNTVKMTNKGLHHQNHLNIVESAGLNLIISILDHIYCGTFTQIIREKFSRKYEYTVDIERYTRNGEGKQMDQKLSDEDGEKGGNGKERREINRKYGNPNCKLPINSKSEKEMEFQEIIKHGEK